MIKRVKKWLGIDGVKIEIDLDSPQMTDKVLIGQIRLYAKEAETIEHIDLKLVEKYSRGRGKSKLIDKYVLGEDSITETIQIESEGEEILSFELPFETLHSEMDQWGAKNPLYKGLVSAAKFVKKVKSTFDLEVSARIKGRAIQPTLRIPVEFD